METEETMVVVEKFLNHLQAYEEIDVHHHFFSLSNDQIF